MKKTVYQSMKMLYSILLMVFLLIVLAGIALSFSLITTIDADGNRVLSNWPQNYAKDFSTAGYLSIDQGLPVLSDAGKKSLDDHLLWLQIVDQNGDQLFSYRTPPEQPAHYSPMAFFALCQGTDEGKYTVCAGTIADHGEQWTYLIGFPMQIKKVTMYLDSSSFSGGKSVLLMLLSFSALLTVICGGICSFWLSSHLCRIMKAVGEISSRRYEPFHAKGLFQDLYGSLNEMNDELLASSRELARHEILREEWITNITHDLKTPLSPIKGYAELFADPQYRLSETSRVNYGQTICRNVEYMEKLLNDLKLTYQLNHYMLPVEKKRASLSRFIKETIIEVLNHPEYGHRKIEFMEADEEVFYCFDEMLLKRAINNLLYNALIHNPADTEIHVRLQVEDQILLTIADRGKGMCAEEMEKLFQRYYRGTNTEAKTEGTGLGMAIAKQIIEISGGSIQVESEPGKGTDLIICFPVLN